jgi:Holliday junction DNA helicase RuvA
MIAFLRGAILSKNEMSLVVEAGGVGYEVACPPQVIEAQGQVGSQAKLFIHTHYKTDGVALFGFNRIEEKSLFLSLIKVDSVGPKSALNILSAAPWDEIVHLIEDGDVTSLSKLPKISKKTAEHLVVKLKGKLHDLLLTQSGDETQPLPAKTSRISEHRRMRLEALTALSHLGFKPQDIERTLADLKEETWQGDLQTVIRTALNDLSGNA